MSREAPKDADIQCYFNINEKGETFHVYCKIIYEAITEELLCEDYEIKNVRLQRKGCARKVSLNIEGVLGGGSERIGESRYGVRPESGRKGKKEVVSFATAVKPPKNTLANLCRDEMDLMKTRPDHCQANSSSKQVYYVPIAICIKTRIPYIEQGKNLLSALISIILKDEEDYTRDTITLSYAEFCSQLLTLTHVTLPPPLTHLVLPIGSAEIFLEEGWVNEFPCGGDTSVVHLFSLLSIDYIVVIWSALLLEKSIVLYVPDPNTYFYIVKALTELMFPLTWPHPKGLVTNLDYLTFPSSYCFGVLKTDYPSPSTITGKLEESGEYGAEYVMAIVEENEVRISSRLKEPLQYPNEERLISNLEDCCAVFGVSEGKVTSRKSSSYKEFAQQIQMIFMNEVAELLNNFEVSIQESEDLLGSNRCFTKLELKKQPSNKPNRVKREFLEKLKDSLAVASFYDEQHLETQGNFARKRAMDCNVESLPPIEPLNVTVCSTPSIVLSRLNKLIELKAGKGIEEVKKDQDKTALKKLFNWREEIAKMKEAQRAAEKAECKSPMSRRGARTNPKLKPSATRLQSSLSSSPERSAKGRTAVAGSEAKICEEVKKRGRCENRFYGRKGILSFLNEFMLSQDEPAHRGMVAEEVRNVEDYFKHSLVQTRTSTGNNVTLSPKNGSLEPSGDPPCSEESAEEDSPAPVVSELVGSLVDVKDFVKMSSFTSRERLLFNFTSSSCFQLELFLAYFHHRQDPNSPIVLKKFMEAFKYVQKGDQYQIYFPIMMLKSLIRRLTVEELEAVTTDSADLKRIVAEIIARKKKTMALMRKRVKTLPREEQKKIVKYKFAYLNNGEPEATSDDPSVVLRTALKELVEIINDCKSEGEEAFRFVNYFNNFKAVKQKTLFLAVFLSCHILA